MADLVTIEEAKEHLRLPPSGTDGDNDLYQKIRQASEIVLDYLKSRGNNVATVSTSSVASPTVITTSDVHTFLVGDTVTIAGHTSTPTVNGSWVISNVTDTSFTVPVAVTVAGTGGTVTELWTPDSVPRHIHAATLLVLEDLHEHRPIDWDAQFALLARSRDPALA
jgi:hypothetical protein